MNLRAILSCIQQSFKDSIQNCTKKDKDKSEWNIYYNENERKILNFLEFGATQMDNSNKVNASKVN